MDLTSATAKAYQAFAAGRNAEAADRAKRILDQCPDDPGALTLIGRLAFASGEPEFAHDVARQLVDRFPQKAALWLDLAFALRALGRDQPAIDAVQRAITLEKGNPAAWVKLGELRLSRNEREAAAGAFRRALDIDPAGVAALRGLCIAEEPDPGSPIAERLNSLVRSPNLRPAEIAGLQYALAQINRRAGRPESFIHHLFAANASQRSICPDTRAEYGAIFDRLESAFTAHAFAACPRAEPQEPNPIFVLGMPRSGTSLLETLVASHPDVACGGELDYLRRSLCRAVERRTGSPFPEGFATLSASEINALAQASAGRLDLVGQGSRWVTDKTPGNYQLLGLLRVLHPMGKIVHMARDPMDTCFSILQYQFDDRSPHTCDVELLAYVYARYLRLMQRWSKLCGDGFITVRYEDLVASPAAEARRVFEHCGLEWQDDYLAVERAGGAVRTFSALQVRRPIYRTSVGAWREFESELAPLRRALEAEGVPT